MNSICVFGDSVARGVIYDEKKEKYTFLKNCFINIFAEDFNIPVTNYAKFGCTITKGVELLKKHQEELSKYDYTILEFGGNDCDYNWAEVAACPEKIHLPNVPFDVFKERYETVIKQVKMCGSRPILLSLPPIEPNRFFNWVSKGLNRENILKWLGTKETIYNWHAQYNEIVLEIAKKHQIPIIDIRKAFENRDCSELICKDGIHPNEKGHALISKSVSVSLASYLAQGHKVTAQL
ncbi:SGNH/GDSL hydrolase family protein [Clostridium aminobutyricum]|uniref:SGNH/GDSL hydrolase family protein n=1 Tax=Clostridium aminobutyricum TaxID=33953 RepID=A0A939IHA1_CLOAM|nr:SGNH/GDSL hydrolase family protein [Clostridium aminobutyricum]MBN7773457.1 SGNH/GDSL hydrolase family protein [Clostridium aminobutyricum]